MYVGTLRDVVNENAITTAIRKGGQVVDNAGHTVGRLIGKGIGLVMHTAPASHIPGLHGLVKGLHKGGSEGYELGDEIIDKHIRKPIGHALGAYDDDKKKNKKK